MSQDETTLWTRGDAECVMVSCCAGAELQLRKRGEIVLRELYPMKSDLYDRARALAAEFPPKASDDGSG